jgi:hypothetical protein
MKEHAKLYIEYDRNRHADGEDRVADLLLSAATGAKTLFTDLYAIGDDVDRATPNVHIDPSTPSAGSLLPRVLKIKPIDAYVCVEVKTANDLKELWKKFIYSSPKMYRVSDCHRLAKDFSLPPYLTEELQSGPIGDLPRYSTVVRVSSETISTRWGLRCCAAGISKTMSGNWWPNTSATRQ